MGTVAKLAKFNDAVHGVVWGVPMLALIIGTGVYLSVRLSFIQARRFGYMWRGTIGEIFKGEFGSDREAKREGEVTPFRAMTAALASSVGVGNIAGVAGAVVVGGAGAIFWMWVSAFFGMATKFAEIVLALRYRRTEPDGSHFGGAMYYIEQGLGLPSFAKIFAVFGGLCCFGIGNATQASEIAYAVNTLFGDGRDLSLVTGVILAAVTAIALMGGIQRISSVTALLVPFMALIYVLGGTWIILSNLSEIPRAFAEIVGGAFSLRSISGGLMGSAMVRAARHGIARGVFSNEAGLGSATMAHAASSAEDPVRQGLWGIFEVFIDTIVVCTVTGLVLVISNRHIGSALTGGALTADAFGSLFRFGGNFVRVSIVLFAFSTILGWSYYGECCWGYLSGGSAAVRFVYRCVYAAVSFIGAAASWFSGGTSTLELMWSIADTLNGLMALPNLIALLLLSDEVVRITRRHFTRIPD